MIKRPWGTIFARSRQRDGATNMAPEVLLAHFRTLLRRLHGRVLADEAASRPRRRYMASHVTRATFALALALIYAHAAPSLTQTTQPDEGQWTMSTKDYSDMRYSGLDQINTQNAKDLKLAWTFSTGIFRGQEAAPLVNSCGSRGSAGSWRGAGPHARCARGSSPAARADHL